MTPADKPRKKTRRLAFKAVKTSVNRKQIPVIYGVHTTFVDQGEEVTLVAPSMKQLESAYDRFTGTKGEFDCGQASDVVIMGLERFNKTRWNRRNPTPNSHA